ncbi:Four helix bundle sensory module for signal transduction [Verrucomicrobium sp. GAS474]|uniref:HAMP domain-containing methyl-accepting chemotaxis protein n=1 Tax=Verrucomicrobium sp. GAS474 TaxID=1882831 RepID=UPI00087A1F4B|nr:methyl-accepting chemotaxis protein [Verrucomicrobium sp. GAS474]SDU20014.1 Four helix bundle sensory module for signal transduction [Verrucomicrobium sp. GAS474]
MITRTSPTKTWPLATKLISAFAVASLITLSVGGLGLFGIFRINSHLTEVGVVRLPSLQGLDMMYEGLLDVRFGNRAMLDSHMEADKVDKMFATIEKARVRGQQGKDIYEPLPQTADEEKLWNIFVPQWAAFLQNESELNTLQHLYWKEPTPEHYDAMQKYTVGKMYLSTAPVIDNLEKLCQIQMDVASQEKEDAGRDSRLVTALALAMSLGGTGLCLALGILITRSITVPIRRVTEDLEAGSAQIASASGQVASAGQTLAMGASEQAASLEETSSSLEEIGSMTRKNTENAEQAKRVSSDARAAAETGAGRTDEMAAATASISQAVQEMSDAIAGIKDSSNDVAKILKTIDEIAFQTNILALNAAVEAARAGASGAGFAVVAEEVRSLAQRSAKAAKETARLIETSTTQSNRGVEASRKVENQIEEIGRKSDAVRETLSAIVEKTARVDSLVAEITMASREQNNGIGQINQAVGQMDKVTQENAAAAEESASAAEELSGQSGEMRQIVVRLNQLVEGTDARNASAPAATSRTIHSRPLPPDAPAAKRHLNGRPPGTIQATRATKTAIPFTGEE